MQTPAPQPTNDAPVVAAPATSRRDFIGLQIQQSEINRQISTLSRSRERLSSQLPGKSGVDRAGLEQQIAQIDKQIIQLQSQSDAVGQQIAVAAPRLFSNTGMPVVPPFGARSGIDDNAVPIVFFGVSFLLLFPFAIVLARRMWRRTPGVTPAVESKDNSARLERLEQAVDTIAIEVERISEGQRFMTRLMTDATSASRQPSARALDAGDPVPGPITSRSRETT